MRVAMGLCGLITVLDHGIMICEDVPGVVQNDQQVIEAYLGKQRRA
jgi:branched-chain amino acid transport system ATP-binding protein